MATWRLESVMMRQSRPMRLRGKAMGGDPVSFINLPRGPREETDITDYMYCDFTYVKVKQVKFRKILEVQCSADECHSCVIPSCWNLKTYVRPEILISKCKKTILVYCIWSIIFTFVVWTFLVESQPDMVNQGFLLGTYKKVKKNRYVFLGSSPNFQNFCEWQSNSWQN